MRNFVQPGNTITTIAPSGGVLAGDPVLVGKLFGIAAIDAAEGQETELATVGVFELNKTSAALSIGSVAYLTSGGAISGTASGNTRIGIVIADAAENAATAHVRLDGAAT